MRRLKLAFRIVWDTVIRVLVSPQLTRALFGPWLLVSGRRGSKGNISKADLRNILVIRLEEIGDVVLLTPFLRELRKSFPSSDITLIVKSSELNLVELCPYVDKVLAFDWNVPSRFNGIKQVKRRVKTLVFALKQLWPKKFDLAIFPRWDIDGYDASFMAYFSGALRRVGFSENVTETKSVRNKGYDRLYTHCLSDHSQKHEVLRPLDLLRFISGTVENESLELWTDEKDEEFVDDVMASYHVEKGSTLIGLGLSGGNSVLKQWPMERYVELVRNAALRDKSLRIILIGGPGEEHLGKAFTELVGIPVLDMIGKATLRQTAALLKRCSYYVGADSGPMHIATAVGVPVVAMFGASCPHRFAPWGANATVVWNELPCSPCSGEVHSDRCVVCIFDYPHCMHGIEVSQVELMMTSPSAALRPCH